MRLLQIKQIICLVLLFGVLGTASPAGSETPLTENDVERFVNSYLPVNVMASEYWGERRYTKRGKILPRIGTYERAAKEMKAAGTYRKFQALLESHGFADFKAWMALKQRFAIAQYNIVSEQRGHPNRAAGIPRRRRAVEKLIEKARENKEGLPPEAVESTVNSFQQVLEHMDMELLGVKDAKAVRPFMEQFATVYEETTKQLGYEPGHVPKQAHAETQKSGVLERVKEAISALGNLIMELFAAEEG